MSQMQPPRNKALWRRMPSRSSEPKPPPSQSAPPSRLPENSLSTITSVIDRILNKMEDMSTSIEEARKGKTEAVGTLGSSAAGRRTVDPDLAVTRCFLNH